ncbi:LapA family protein [Sporanaerobacter acetigenes]|uniref:Uncharacterized integral membrane protein n=1 Tax=Sporanaerobacter acetigenes DSM 13106 TaxID=1123281 RepID=A0A1M5XUF2_9FIRM|nr:LapA family protein [Sporanaerobacter acetigenes]SHI03430.1 Uncharacterized integral membrane protein [Sporanaerobacter acetigenes DSM 13106]
MQWGFILSLIFATLVTIFALRNANEVLIDFLFGKVNISQALVIFISAILGAVIVAIMGGIRNLRLKKEVKELNKKLELLVQENKNYQILLTENEHSEEQDIVANDEKFEESNNENKEEL